MRAIFLPDQLMKFWYHNSQNIQNLNEMVLVIPSDVILTGNKRLIEDIDGLDIKLLEMKMKIKV